MYELIIILFWVSIGAIIYAYLGYPFLLWILTRMFGDKNYSSDNELINLPSVSLIISAYNEEDIIEDKIHNSLALEYPKDLLEINIVSDGSTDRTNKIVDGYKNKGIRLLIYEGRIGKTSCLNKAVPECKGEIVIFSDANSMYDAKAAIELVKHFQSKEIGLVTGRTKYFSDNNNVITESTNLYTKIEILTKKFESRFNSCIGADGAIFAIRKELYQPLSSYDINDLVIPLNIIKKGFRVILEENAFCLEKAASNDRAEFARQVRITSRTLRALFNSKELLNPFRFPIISFEIISHKFSKLLVPCFLAILLATNIILFSNGILYILLLSSQILLYSLVAYYFFSTKISQNKILSITYSFVIVNIAYLIGWIKYLSGESYSTWQPERKQG